ncbi:putative carbonyl reductase [Viridothelium virens]|uniref:Putative carbonyl reductase n=1 Tax=Viridothelium virens TaxID=1048519 RepID=A0A6A6GWF8_VIRVR|nr:putative carbonyl reductase [Viridothelium virens]
MAASKTLVLITGANQGIGFETAKNLLLASNAYHVLLGTRDLTKGTASASALKTLPIKGQVEPIQIDVTKDDSVDAAAAHVESTYGKLDILVNNAGIFSKNPKARDAFREILAVNSVGVVSVTEAFLPLLRKSSAPRLIFVGSSVGSIRQAADPNSKYYAPAANEYRASKAALNMLLVQYWVKLQKENFKVFGADPGLIATNFVNPEQVRKRGAMEPDVGGERVASVVRGDRDADVGRMCGEYGVSPW